METPEQLKLGNQVCFPIYSVSRLLTKAYKPYLDEMGITYPQYLVLMVLWENNCVTVNHISEKLLLNTNTVSPLLKRMENSDLIRRKRSIEDERSIIIQLTKKGDALKNQATPIPDKLLKVLFTENIELSDIVRLKETLDELIIVLSNKNN
ncbi:MarR family winged helix-turn-helix transcriptional regulator [Patiriisocius sp. Uisw_017]|jgi:DNA-binding MarR family transcriptional regulator|uniref:MarR family winged helix-turn-helix transcriptional regulator n=1 Tax=Patiriisocius sp. Uisw_017 TaxID=3230968 RepID=UPI0039EBA21B